MVARQCGLAQVWETQVTSASPADCLFDAVVQTPVGFASPDLVKQSFELRLEVGSAARLAAQ